jgi:IS30 family transposase
MELTEVKRQFIELRAQGWSFDKIAKELGKAKQTLLDWSKELEDEIANLKAMELEALYEAYYLHRENRLKMFGEILSRLREEVGNRDLSELPTDKLLELLLKYNTQIKEEIVEPTFKSSQEIEEERMDRELLDELTSSKPSHPIRRLKVG